MLFSRHSSPEGPSLRVRLARTADRRALADLLTRLDHPDADLAAARMLRYDPRRRLVLCATAWDGGREVVVGVAVTAGRGGALDVLITDEDLAPGAGDALRDGALARVVAGHAA